MSCGGGTKTGGDLLVQPLTGRELFSIYVLKRIELRVERVELRINAETGFVVNGCSGCGRSKYDRL